MPHDDAKNAVYDQAKSGRGFVQHPAKSDWLIKSNIFDNRFLSRQSFE